MYGQSPEPAAEPLFSNGVPRDLWYRFVFDSNYGAMIRDKVARERAAQGLPATVEVEVESDSTTSVQATESVHHRGCAVGQGRGQGCGLA